MSRRAVPWVILALAGAVSLAATADAGSRGTSRAAPDRAHRPHWQVITLPVKPGKPYSFAEP